MKDTMRSLLESATTTTADFKTKNIIAFNSLDTVCETVQSIKYDPRKVIISKVDNSYFIEFTANVERLMKDNEYSISEAMDLISAYNDIPLSECTLVLDESAIDTLDITKLISTSKEYLLATK